MKIGYPCINQTLPCSANKTFRLHNFSEERLCETLTNNLNCLRSILEYNVKHNLLFFRLTSDLVPFASHPVNTFPWQKHFQKQFRKIGSFIKRYAIRISIHPDQFTLINAKEAIILKRSIRELEYHAQILDCMRLPLSAKIQLHVGGIYNDKAASLKRFAARYCDLPRTITRRLVIENDDRLYDLHDCINISCKTGIPIVFDLFHNELNASDMTFIESIRLFTKTWKTQDGLPIIDYSTGQRKGFRKHADTIDINHFLSFLSKTKPFDFDIMLEIKDKESSAIKALKIADQDQRLFKVKV